LARSPPRPRHHPAPKTTIALYPTPATPPPPPTLSRHSSPNRGTLASSKSPSGVAGAALGWFSAGAKALASGAAEVTRSPSQDGNRPGPREAGEAGEAWEGWSITIELAREAGRGVGEERLRAQLSDFLLRAVLFAQSNTPSVPPIVSGGLEPFGIQVSQP